MKKLETKEFNARVARYFKLNPDAEKLYFTEDGSCFYNTSDARIHAGDGKVIALSGVPEAEPMTREEAEKVLKETELTEETSYDLVCDLAEALEVKGESRKKADLIAALFPVQEELLKGES